MANTSSICTVHQPSSELFSLFDRVLLLAEGGRVAFFGTPVGALQFFGHLEYFCPPNYNPADHLIQQVAVVPHKEAESSKRIGEICDEYKMRCEPNVIKENA